MAARGSPIISTWWAPLSSRSRGVLLACSLMLVAVLWQPRGAAMQGGNLTVTGTVALAGAFLDRSDVIVWLTPFNETGRSRPGAGRRFKVVQQGKRFQPHVLAVPVGAFVDFPNLDPIFHNVFSLFDGKRFDLGLYEAGTTRGVAFTKPGVCYVFCNIHPEMSAVVVVVDSPYFTASTSTGAVTIADVPPGRYRLSVWHERFKPETPSDYPKDVVISPGNSSLGTLRMVESKTQTAPHTNKFGHEYLPPSSASPVYP